MKDRALFQIMYISHKSASLFVNQFFIPKNLTNNVDLLRLQIYFYIHSFIKDTFKISGLVMNKKLF